MCDYNHCTNVQALHAAIGAAAGTLQFSDLKQDDVNHVIQTGKSSVPDPVTYGSSRSTGVSVPVLTLDDVLAGTPVSFLKIDVEGFEKAVLEGATDTLRHTEVVYIESFERSLNEYGYHTRDIVSILLGYGTNWITVGADHVSATVENLLALRRPDMIAGLQG